MVQAIRQGAQDPIEVTSTIKLRAEETIFARSSVVQYYLQNISQGNGDLP